MNENRNTYEKEINLMELLFYCLKRWRWIVAAMLVMAVLAGGYKYHSVVKSNQVLQEAQQLQAKEDKAEDVIVNPNIEYYELAIERSEEALKQKDQYISSSVVMQLDANCLATGTLSFYVNSQEDESNTLEALITAYRAYVTDGRLAEQLQREDESVSKADLQYLITFTSGKTDSFSSEDVMRMWPEQNVFQVQLTASGEELMSAYLTAAEAAIGEYHARLQEDVAAHDLRLLASVQTERIDSAIRDYQSKVLSDYTAGVKSLQSLRKDLETVRSEEGETISVNESVVLDNPVSAAVKFGGLGLVLGAFLAVFALALIYVMSSRLQSTEAFEEEFGMKLLGCVETESGKKKIFGFVDHWIYRMEKGAYANIPLEEQVKIAGSNLKAAISRDGGLKKVMLAGTIAGKDASVFCSQFTEGIEGVIFSEYKQPVFSSADLEELEDCDAVLFLEKKGVSVSGLIHQERELAAARNVKVLGAVVV